MAGAKVAFLSGLPQVVVDAINTATVLGYSVDVIQSGRTLADLAGRILTALATDDGEPLRASLG
ncbi:MAG: hypothetical protein IIB04_03825 [Acidobacteria bacterium]|nr:hypothetical protein [Acidobacteriota bacterium]